MIMIIRKREGREEGERQLSGSSRAPDRAPSLVSQPPSLGPLSCLGSNPAWWWTPLVVEKSTSTVIVPSLSRLLVLSEELSASVTANKCFSQWNCHQGLPRNFGWCNGLTLIGTNTPIFHHLTGESLGPIKTVTPHLSMSFSEEMSLRWLLVIFRIFVPWIYVWPQNLCMSRSGVSLHSDHHNNTTSRWPIEVDAIFDMFILILKGGVCYGAYFCGRLLEGFDTIVRLLPHCYIQSFEQKSTLQQQFVNGYVWEIKDWTDW